MIEISLHDKLAFVTGSTRGIGWEVARLLAKAGASVVLHGKAESPVVQERLGELKSINPKAQFDFFAADLQEPKAIENCFKGIFQKYKSLHITVNNAGILDDALIGMIQEEALQRTFNINALATAYSIQASARLMSRNPQGGSIINISSIIGTNGNIGQLAYGGSKAAVIGMTKSAAKELAEKKIRVNAIAPGFIETDMVKQLSPEKFQERLASIKMKRIGSPQDVANLVLFLASDLSAYITGQTIGVDGAMLI